MKSGGLASIIQKKYTPYKQSKELVLERDNILEQDFSTTLINQKWVSDITYIYIQRKLLVIVFRNKWPQILS